MTAATRKAYRASTGGQCQAAQDREERARWTESMKIARIEAQ